MKLKWMPDAGNRDRRIGVAGPYLAVVSPREDRGWQWTLACQPAGQAQQIIGHDVCDSFEAGREAAEARLQAVRRIGRLPKVGRAMTPTERSKQRAARLAAKAAAEEVMSLRLHALSNDLSAKGLTMWADRVAQIRRNAALIAVAEYTRRNATFFVTDGPKTLDRDARSRRIRRITALADRMDGLAQEQGSYRAFETILDELHKLGFWPENSLVSEVAHAFHAPAIG